MNLRPALGLTLCGAAAVACAALYFWSPAAALSGVVFALAGLLAARLVFGAGEAAGDARPAAASGPRAAGAVDAEAAPTVAGAVVAGEVPAGALLEATMDSMREGVLVIDDVMRVVALNHAARRLFGAGASAPAPAQRRLSELTRNPAIYSAFAAAVARGQRSEVKVETRAGERRVYDLHVAPLTQRGTDQARGQEVRGAVGVFFDITRLEQLERVRQEFLSNVSHELRTPLTAILTFVETLEDGAAEDAANRSRFLSVIRRNAERMHGLINDILELSAIESGQVAVEPSAVRLSQMVNECLTTLQSRAAERGVSLRNEVGREVVVHADARRLEQMLTNLVDNAVKFNRAGGAVTVRHERAEDGRDRIHVADTGEGIAPEHLARIFERFYRVDRARSRALGGTGLGLAIVKHLARAHGGEATVRSTPGEGSTFTVELPDKSKAEG